VKAVVSCNRRCLCHREIVQDRRGKAPGLEEDWEGPPETTVQVLNSLAPADKAEAVERVREPAQVGDREVDGAPDAESVVARAVPAEEGGKVYFHFLKHLNNRRCLCHMEIIQDRWVTARGLAEEWGFVMDMTRRAW